MKLRAAVLMIGLGAANPQAGPHGQVPGAGSGRIAGPQRAAIAPTDALFVFANFLGKCLDSTSAAQGEFALVYVTPCNNGPQQRIEIQEVGPSRAVLLKAAGKCLSPTLKNLVPQMPLSFHVCDGSDFQKFLLDGDSVIAAIDRTLVVKVTNQPGSLRDQLWFNHRELDDTEFWSLRGTGTTTRPTSGFVRVPQDEPDLVAALAAATDGSVVQLNTNVSVPANTHLPLNAGVTLRGGRHDVDLGPQIFAASEDNDGLLVMQGDFTRVTGLRVRGPSRTTDTVPQAVGVAAKDQFHAIIDHNDISDWPHAGVEVRGMSDADCMDLPPIAQGRNWRAEPWQSCCDRYRNHPPLTTHVLVTRNFIHHNRMQGRGYGVVSYSGAYPFIKANTFTQNRHAIAADGKPETGYQAVYNLVLSLVPVQEFGKIVYWHTQDFDIHGRFAHGDYFGSAAGRHSEILSNTFLGTNTSSIHSDHPNFHLRGTPCDAVIYSGNVSLESQYDAISYDGEQENTKLQVTGDLFNWGNATMRLAVGDFDGDGFDDLFLATGNAWYFSPRGKAEWRFLQQDSTQVNVLLFGDFDGDGRTDVFKKEGNDWMISWGGISFWEKVGTHAEPLADYRVGNFDHDKRADIFVANGAQWLFSSGATGPLQPLRAASTPSSGLRLGDFNGDGLTDVLVPDADGRGWTIFETGTGRQTHVERHDPVKYPVLLVGDFNGDGKADVSSVQPNNLPHAPAPRWVYSPSGGAGPWLTFALRTDSIAQSAATGHFLDTKRVDALVWNGTHFTSVSTPPGGSGTWSRQDMK